MACSGFWVWNKIRLTQSDFRLWKRNSTNRICLKKENVLPRSGFGNENSFFCLLSLNHKNSLVKQTPIRLIQSVLVCLIRERKIWKLRACQDKRNWINESKNKLSTTDALETFKKKYGFWMNYGFGETPNATNCETVDLFWCNARAFFLIVFNMIECSVVSENFKTNHEKCARVCVFLSKMMMHIEFCVMHCNTEIGIIKIGLSFRLIFCFSLSFRLFRSVKRVTNVNFSQSCAYDIYAR